MDEAVKLDFDPSAMIGHIKAISKEWNNMVSVIESTDKKVKPTEANAQKEMKKTEKSAKDKGEGIQMSFKKLLGIGALIGGAIGAVRGLLSGIPEIGKTFEIAGDIISRNLLSPLRQELLPILNSVLKWVSDNRAAFVEMGVFIANIFQFVFGVLKQVVGVLQVIFNQIKKTVKSLVGDTAQSIGDTFRTILTKIAVFVTFLLILLQPLFEGIGKAIGIIIVSVKNFIEGLVKGFMFVAEKIKLWETIDKIGKAFSELMDELAPVVEVFKFLGMIAGGIIAVALKILLGVLTAIIKVVSAVVRGIVSFIKAIVNAAKSTEFFKNLIAAIPRILTWLGSVFDAVIQGISDFADWIRNNIGAAISTFVGKIIEFGGKIKDFFIGVKDFIVNIFKEVFGWISSTIDKFVNLISNVVTKVKNFFGGGEDPKEANKKIEEMKKEVSQSRLPTTGGSNKQVNQQNSVTIQNNFNLTGENQASVANATKENINKNTKEAFRNGINQEKLAAGAR